MRNSQGSHSDSCGLGDLKYEPPLPETIGSSHDIGSNGASMALSQENLATHVALSQQSGIPKRWVIVVLCFFSFLLCNMDRASKSMQFYLKLSEDVVDA
jgi:hypothetical protein